MLKQKINEYKKLLKMHYSHLFITVRSDAKASAQANDLAVFASAKQAILETVLEKHNINLSETLTNNNEMETAKLIQKIMNLTDLDKRKLH